MVDLRGKENSSRRAGFEPTPTKARRALQDDDSGKDFETTTAPRAKNGTGVFARKGSESVSYKGRTDQEGGREKTELKN